MLKERILTGSVLALALLAVIFFGSYTLFKLVFAVAIAVAAWEWSKLLGFKKTPANALYTVLVLAVAFLLPESHQALALYVAVIWWLFAFAIIVMYPRGAKLWTKGFVLRAAMGVLVLAPIWYSLSLLYQFPNGQMWVFWAFLTVAFSDSFAYFIGRQWGVTKILPNVSPAKSWQGFGGAMLGCCVLSAIVIFVQHLELKAWQVLALFLVAGLAAVIGDLFESVMKRVSHVKDSGKILPGHGGVLDRLDSLSCTLPVFVTGLLWLELPLLSAS